MAGKVTLRNPQHWASSASRYDTSESAAPCICVVRLRARTAVDSYIMTALTRATGIGTIIGAARRGCDRRRVTAIVACGRRCNNRRAFFFCFSR
jgi:hypothetical protein